MNDNADNDLRLYAIPDIHGHAKGEHKAFTDERPIPLSARMLFLWFYHACRRGWPRFLMVTDHMNYLTFEDPAAINLVRRALKLAQAGDLYGAAETASVEVGHAAVVSEGLRRGMRYSIGAEIDNDPRSRPDAQNIVDAMKPDGMIRSVHFLTIDHPVHGANWSWPFDNPEFVDVYETVGTARTWELYMATLLDAVERLPGHIVGHFYVPALFGHWPDDAILEAYEDRIVDACEARGMAIELNTRFLYRDHSDEEKAKYLAAHRRLLTKCKAKNVGIAVGSDAHSPKDQGRGFETILALLDDCQINELVFPLAGRLARVALRVERKAEPAAVAELPAQPPDDDRKTVRKARTSEVPARPKESSSKREDVSGSENAAPADDGTAAKSKPRPKRSKNRAAAAPDSESDDVAADGAAASGSEQRAADLPTPASTESPSIESAVSPDPPEAGPAHSNVSGDAAGESVATVPTVDAPEEVQPRTGAPAGTPADADESDVGDLGRHERAAAEESLRDSIAMGAHEPSANGARSAEPSDETAVARDAGAADLEIDEGVIVETTAVLVTDAELDSIVSETAVDNAGETASEDPSYATHEKAAFELVPGVEIDVPVGSPRADDADEDAIDEAILAEPIRSAPASVPKARPKAAVPKAKAAAPGKAKAPAKHKPAPKKPAKPGVKAGAKKVPAKKAPAKKVVTKSAGAKKTTVKKPIKKSAVRTGTAKKAAVKKSTAKKASAKKTASKRR